MSENHHESSVSGTKTSYRVTPNSNCCLSGEEISVDILNCDQTHANVPGPAYLGEVETYSDADTLPDNVKSKQKHLNGVHVHVISRGCKDWLKIHRCLSDGRLTELNDDGETHIARSLSSSDCYMNGFDDTETVEKANNMAGADKKSMDSVQKSKQKEENLGKPKPVNGERHAEANAMGLSNSDNPSGVLGNDIVRPKTWSRKLAEKCRLRKDTAKESARNNTQSRCNRNVTDGNGKPRTKTCRAYEHDRELIKQQRAGLVNGNSDIECSVLEIPLPLPNDSRLPSSNHNVFGVPSHLNGIMQTESMTDTMSGDITENESHKDVDNGLQSSNTEMPALVVAPLAEPEDTSDNEFGAFYSRNPGINTLMENSDNKSAIDQSEYEVSENNAELRPERLSVCDIENENINPFVSFQRTEVNDDVCTDASIGFAEYPESIFSRAPDEEDASLSYGYSSPVSNAMSGASQSQTQTLIDRQSSGRNDAMNAAYAAAQNLPQASSSSLESLEEIGDYIETDLPPNRLAFFSRGSSSSTTTDEDEGCGDEVLPNNDEESDNETIDPLSSYHNPGLPNLPDVHYNNKPLSFSMNFSSDRSQNMTFRNPNWGQSLMGNVTASSNSARNVRSCDSQNVSVNENDAENHISENLENNSVVKCASCEHSQLNDFVCENKEDKSKETGETSHVHDSNDRNPLESAINSSESNDSQKRQNSLDGVPRLSSSDSDPAGMVFMMSDDSENVSPEYESGTEYVFPSMGLSASFSGAMGGAHSKQQPSFVFGDPSDHPRNQTASLDFDRDDEILHYPFFVRRARSLDQDIDTRCRIQNRLSEIDVPNIPPVASSNLQHHESNQNQKVFEKSALELMVPLPVWDSSDEDENNRVPDIEPLEEEPLDQIFESMENRLMQRQGETGNHCPASNISMPADEPIYEEIDDLLVLMDEICSEGEPDNLQPVCNAISKLRRKRRHRSPVSDVEKVMIWNEYEAYVVQVKQIGTSACGPTAVLNVLKAFDFQVEKEEVCQTITSNMRMEAAPIPYYLFSRSTAGTTAQALVEGVASVTRGAIKGRFFHFYPQRDVELTKWLGHWMKKGAVPVATLNLQRGVKPGWTIPDAWHHQMVYGVSSKGVYLTNPLEIVPESVIMDQLTSDSVLLVRRHDIISRFRDWCPLNEILKQRDNRWRTMNVIGQVVHMLRESMVPQEQLPGARAQLTSHISIPAVYKAGIILFMRANTDTYEELLKAPELPLKDGDNMHQP